MVGLISTCHDTIFVCPHSNRVLPESKSEALQLRQLAVLWTNDPTCPPHPRRLCFPLLSHRERFNPLRVSCIALTARGLSLHFHEVTEDRTAACSPMSHRAPVGAELVSSLCSCVHRAASSDCQFRQVGPLRPSVRPSVSQHTHDSPVLQSL